MTYTIDQLMHAWADAALAVWKRNVRDDQKGVAGNRTIIGDMFRQVGWGFWIPNGYREQGGRNAWCGHFQSFCGLYVGDYLESGRSVGIMLDPSLAKSVLASTRRLADPNRWSAAGHVMPPVIRDFSDGPYVEDLFDIPRLATVATRDDYGDYRDRDGGHVVLITGIDWAAQTVTTIEGNGYGYMPDDTWAEGVIRRHGKRARPIDSIRCVYMLDESHFDTMEVDK